LAAAKSRGRNGGRPQALTVDQIKMGKALSNSPDLTVNQICEQLGCSRATYYRVIAPQMATNNIP